MVEELTAIYAVNARVCIVLTSRLKLTTVCDVIAREWLRLTVIYDVIARQMSNAYVPFATYDRK